MKILFDHSLPFSLAHGGFQTQIEETKAALERRGIEVEYLRWWDDRQTGNIIHHFGVPSVSALRLARERKIASVVTHLFTATCNRSSFQLFAQGLTTRVLLRLLGGVGNQLSWRAFQSADKMVVGLKAERQVLQTVFGVPGSAIEIVPLGLHEDFLKASASPRSGSYLITTGTITDRKRSIELARMAREAETPLLFVGKPYGPDDPYGKEFAKLVDGRFVLHRDHISDRETLIEVLQASRGFVIYSRFENWCLSAHEAAACGLPVLLPNLPWSRECFGGEASYLSSQPDRRNVARLRAFYEACPTSSAPAIRFYSWDDVAERLENCYREVSR